MINKFKHAWVLFRRQFTVDPEEFTQEDWQAANTMAFTMVTVGFMGNLIMWTYIILT